MIAPNFRQSTFPEAYQTLPNCHYWIKMDLTHLGNLAFEKASKFAADFKLEKLILRKPEWPIQHVFSPCFDTVSHTMGYLASWRYRCSTLYLLSPFSFIEICVGWSAATVIINWRLNTGSTRSSPIVWVLFVSFNLRFLHTATRIRFNAWNRTFQRSDDPLYFWYDEFTKRVLTTSC